MASQPNTQKTNRAIPLDDLQNDYQSLSLETMLSGYQLSQALFSLHHLKLPECFIAKIYIGSY